MSGAAKLDIQETERDGFVVFGLSGRLDTKTTHEFEKKVGERLAAGSRRFVVDLADTEYVSSAGLRVLLMLAKKAAPPEGYLALAAVNESVRQVLDVSGFTSFFALAASTDDAIRKAPRADKAPRILDQAARALGVRKAASEPADKKASEVGALASKILGRPKSRSGDKKKS